MLAALLLVSAASAQDNPNDRTITVTGRRQASEKQAQRFVRQLVATNTGQLARFVEPVCPHILGLPPTLAGNVEGRIRRDAAAAEVPLAPEPCEPNLIGVVATNSDAFIKFMRKRHGSFFDDLSDVDLHDAFKSGVVHSWRLIEERDEDGAPASGDPPAIESYTSSAFSQPTQAATVNAVIVLDKKAVLDKTVAQLADYIAMRTLAGARPPGEDGAVSPTILSLFDPGATPQQEMTSMDAGLLAGLYASKPTVDAPSQVNDISRQMVRARAPTPK